MKMRRDTERSDAQGCEQLANIPLFSDGSLPANFTDRVMEEIRITAINSASEKKLSDVSGMQRSRKRTKALQWGSAAAVAAVASSLLFLNPAAPEEPILPVPAQSLRTVPDQWGAMDLQEAWTLGLIQQPGIQIHDQGYTLFLQEVVADPVRTVLNIRITDSRGIPAKDAMSSFDFSQLQLLNEAGRSIGQLKGVYPVEKKSSDGEFLQESMLLTYIFPDEDPGDQVLIQGNVHELTEESQTSKTLTGEWSFSYEADLTKAKQLSVTEDLDHKYSSPDGLHIEMEQLVHTPAGIRLDFTTSLTDESAVQIPMGFSDDFGVMYHFETDNGEELTRVNSSRDGGYLDKSFGYTMKASGQDHKVHWSYYFAELSDDHAEPIRFVLDGYYYPVESSDALTFRPQDLKNKPAVWSAQGDVLNVNDMKITEIPDEPGLSGWMSVSGEFANKFYKDKWVAIDDQGREHEVIFRGSFTDGVRGASFGETEDHANEAYFIAKNMTELPEELTLIRTVTHKRFTGMDWSFELPEITLPSLNK